MATPFQERMSWMSEEGQQYKPMRRQASIDSGERMGMLVERMATLVGATLRRNGAAAAGAIGVDSNHVVRRRQMRRRDRSGGGSAMITLRRSQRGLCRRVAAPPLERPFLTTTPTLWTSALAGLFGLVVMFPLHVEGAAGARRVTAGAAAISAERHRHDRYLQNSSTQLPSCPSPLDNGGVYAVSLSSDADDLATDLAACTGGAYNVTWSGAVVLRELLVVAAGSSLTITGAEGADGEAAALVGGSGVNGLVDLGEGSSLRLQGVILRNGTREVGNGGAVRAEGAESSVFAIDSVFEGNRATSLDLGEGDGGALSLGSGSSARLENCTLSGNRAAFRGGGVWSGGDDCSLTLTDCLLEENSAYQGGGVGLAGPSTVVFEGSKIWNNFAEMDGGGAFGVNATVMVLGGSEFVNNTGEWSGGGISLHDMSNLTITESTFRGNYISGNGSYGSGGGVRVQGTHPPLPAAVSIVDSVFEDNFASYGGGLWVSSGFVLTAERSIFHRNAGRFGGGLNVGSEGVSEFKACNFTEGFSWNGGGGLLVANSRATIYDCVFNGNADRFQGGALIAEETAVVSIERSTFVNNYIDGSTGAGSGGAVVVSNSTLTANACVFHNNQGYHDDLYEPDTDPLVGGGAVELESASIASFASCNFSSNGGALGGAVLAEGASTATFTDVVMATNVAGVYGGALSCHDESSCVMSDSRVEGNTAGVGAGGLHFRGAVGDLDGVLFVGNSASAGSGGAILFSSGSNVTVEGGHFTSNNASENGGHVFATGSGTNVDLSSSHQSLAEHEEDSSSTLSLLALTDGDAGVNGGAVHASGDAIVVLTSVEISGNRAAEGDGGAVAAHGSRMVWMDGCNITANTSGKGGGGASVANSAFYATDSSFTENYGPNDGGGLRGYTGADVRLESCLIAGNEAQVGGGISGLDAKFEARSCQILGNIAGLYGGGLRFSYQTRAEMEDCEVSFNTAGFDGGGLALDASSGGDDSLSASNASSTFVCQGGGVLEGNSAGERGGAVYVARESNVTLDSCGTRSNLAALGASVYASQAFVNLRGSELANDEVPTGPMIYAMRTQLDAFNTSFLVEDRPSMLAVQTSGGSYMRVLGCSFVGWEGAYVILAGGELEMDLCDFTESHAEVLVAATNESSPARIRNTVVGIESYADIASSSSLSTEASRTTTLALNAMSCSSGDPCGERLGGTTPSSGVSSDIASSAAVKDSITSSAMTLSGGHGGSADRRLAYSSSSVGAEGQNQGKCVDGSIGVYCTCFIATITEEEECLEETTTVQLNASTEQLMVTGVNGTIETILNVTAGDGRGSVVWKVEEVANFSEVVVWTIVPDVGVLEEGETVTIALTGHLVDTFSGEVNAQFKAESIMSGNFALAMVNTTFYYCGAGEYRDDHECFLCSDLDLGDEGLDCDLPGVRLETLPVTPGYWRSSRSTTIIRQCLNDEACAGGSVIQEANDYCADGYHGPYCAVCSSGYAGGISNGCHQCTQAFRVGMIVLASVVGILALAMLWLLLRYLVQAPSRTLSCFAWRTNGVVSKARQIPLHKFKIPIVVFQIITQYVEITNVEFPPAFTKFLTFWDAVNLDPGWVLSASCIISPNFYGRLLLSTLGPIALVAGLGCTFLYAKGRVIRSGLSKSHSAAISGMSESRQLSVVKSRHIAVLVTGTFLIYSTVSTIVFQAFVCDTLGELDATYLRADYSLMCNTAVHNSYKIYASVMILVYPVGIPVLYAWLLFRHRHRIYPKQMLREGVSPERRFADKKIAHTVILWEAYRPSRYYYEVIECGRRVLLTGCMVFILPGSPGQAGVACVLSVFTVCLFVTLRPFADANDGRLYVLGSLVIFLSMFVSLLPELKITDGDSQSQTVLSWLLIALSSTLWVMAFVQCFWEVRAMTQKSDPSELREPSSAANLMGSFFSSRRGVGESKSDGTNYSPEERDVTPLDIYNFSHGNSAASGKSNIVSGGSSKADYKSSVAAAAGQLHPSGYADPVMLDFNNGMHGVGSGGSGGVSAAGHSGNTSHHSHHSGNTYGPLKEETAGGGGIGSGTSITLKFPPINMADDGNTTGSPIMAEQMFSRRVGAGSAGVATGGSSGSTKLRQGNEVEAVAARATITMDSSTMAEEMFARRLETCDDLDNSGTGNGGGIEDMCLNGAGTAGGESAMGGVTGTQVGGADARHSTLGDNGSDETGDGGTSRGVSPAEPMTNGYPHTISLPESTGTPVSQPPGVGGGGGSRYRVGSAGPLSPSPVSSISRRSGVGRSGGQTREGKTGPRLADPSPSSSLAPRPSSSRRGWNAEGTMKSSSPSPCSPMLRPGIVSIVEGSYGAGPLTQSPSSSLAPRPGGARGTRSEVGSMGPLSPSPTSSLAVRTMNGKGRRGEEGRGLGVLSPSTTRSPVSSLALVDPSPGASSEMVIPRGQDSVDESVVGGSGAFERKKVGNWGA